MTGINMVHVPYRGDAPAMTDLLGGQGPSLLRYPYHFNRANQDGKTARAGGDYRGSFGGFA
jgi:hypothetical protein